MGTAAADVVFVLGDVGQLQEIGKGADDGLRRIARQGVEQAGKLGTGGRVAVAGEADRRLADALDNVEDGVAFLLADGVAENAA